MSAYAPGDTALEAHAPRLPARNVKKRKPPQGADLASGEHDQAVTVPSTSMSG